jgi:hypothetical protein
VPGPELKQISPCISPRWSRQRTHQAIKRGLPKGAEEGLSDGHLPTLTRRGILLIRSMFVRSNRLFMDGEPSPKGATHGEGAGYWRRVLKARDPKALAGWYREHLGPEHPETLQSMNSLAVVLARKGDDLAAEPLYRQTLAARERVLGPDHIDTLLSVNNLAVLLYHRGAYAAAEPLFRHALNGVLKISQGMKAVHPDVQNYVNKYQKCLEKLGGQPDEIRHRVLLIGADVACASPNR